MNYKLKTETLYGNALLIFIFLLHVFTVYMTLNVLGLTELFNVTLYSDFLHANFYLILMLKLAHYLMGKMKYPRSERNIGVYINDFKGHWGNINHLVNLIVPFLIIPTFIALFSVGKSVFVKLQPFYLDEFFANLDRVLHFGVDPWVITHFFFGTPVLSVGLSFIYGFWFVLMLLFTLWHIISVDLGKHRLQYLITFLLSWLILGLILATALSSAGPSFYGKVTGDYALFAPLMEQLNNFNEPYKDGYFYIYPLELQDYIWESYISTTIDVGTGISAMPSMHLAITTLLYLSAKEFNKYLGYMMLVFLILIQIGSVHLAWHYAVDGYFAILMTWIIWKMVGKLCDKIYQDAS